MAKTEHSSSCRCREWERVGVWKSGAVLVGPGGCRAQLFYDHSTNGVSLSELNVRYSPLY